MSSRESSDVRAHSSSNMSISSDIPGDWKQHVNHKDIDPLSTKYVVYETEVRSKKHRDRVGTCLYEKFQNKLEMRNFIELLQVIVLEPVRVSHDDSVYKSLKLTVYPENYFKNMTHICGHLVYVSENIVHNTIPESKKN